MPVAEPEMMNPEYLIAEVRAIAADAGKFLKSEQKNITPGNVEQKGEHDYVTYVDKASESFLIQNLGRLMPAAGFIAEESSRKSSSMGLNWVIDPLDGTTNFIQGVPLYSVSIALMDGNNVILGVIYEPNLDECYYAHCQGDAFMNGDRIRVSENNQLAEAFLATGFPSRDYSRLEEYMGLFRHLVFLTRGIRRLGSAALDLAWVAGGRFDGFYEYGLSPWDVAAGVIITERAGGMISDFSGGRNHIFGGEIIATNRCINEELSEMIHKFFRGDLK